MKYQTLAADMITMCSQYLLGNVTDSEFEQNIEKSQKNIDEVKHKEYRATQENKPPIPKISGYALNRLFSDGDDDFTFTQDIIDYYLEEEDDNWSEFLGWEVSVDKDGEHHHDGQLVDYYIIFTSPAGFDYSIYNRHCLMTGWNFEEDVMFN